MNTVRSDLAADDTSPSEAPSRQHWRCRISRRKFTKWASYFFIFAFLVAFCEQTREHLYIPSRKQKDYPQRIETANFTAVPVTAGYPLSGPYGLTPVTIIWGLVPVTILVRRALWLSTPFIGLIMIYSSTAGIHLIVLFVHNSRFDHNAARNACEEYRLPGGGILPICQGIHDPDYILAGGIVAANLLAVLPFAKWSLTFRDPETQAVLILWTLWLAIGHLFFILIIPNDGINYQICPKGVTEPLPGMEYHARDRDEKWNQRLEDIVLGRTNSALIDEQQCIYSAFGRDGYLGRRRDEIGIFDASLSNRYLNPRLRGIGIAFWIIYTILAAVGLLASKSHERHLKYYVLQLGWWRGGRLHTWLKSRSPAVKQFDKKMGQQAWCQRLNTTINTSLEAVVWPFVKISELVARTWVWERLKGWLKEEFKTQMGFDSECLVCLVKRYFVQFLSGVSFFGFVAFGYVEFVQIPKSEPFSAVGQWGSVAAIFFVLLAAILVKVSLMIIGPVERMSEQSPHDLEQQVDVGIELIEMRPTETFEVDFEPAIQRANDVELPDQRR